METETKSANKDVAKWILTAVLLAAYSAGIYFLAQNVGAEETKWGRFIFMFQGFEVMVFAAIGWVFGREVNRVRADKAEDRADNAQKKIEDKDSKLNTVKQKLISLDNYIQTHSVSASSISILDFGDKNLSLDERGEKHRINESVNSNWTRLAEFSRKQLQDV
jgi:hypothetical protein